MIKTKISTAATSLWIVFGITVIAVKFDSVKAMPLNELGDFLSGFFSPVAFLWLVVGYFQQGEELKLNTRALELQVTELRMSVEQQRELVEVTRAEMTLTKQAHELEISREERMAQPIFQLQVGSYTSGVLGAVEVDAMLSNHGHSATSLVLKCNSGTISIKEVSVLPSDQKRAMKISLSPPSWEFVIDIDYLDGLDQRKRQIFSAVKNEQGKLIFLPPKEIYLTDV